MSPFSSVTSNMQDIYKKASRFLQDSRLPGIPTPAIRGGGRQKPVDISVAAAILPALK